MSHEVVAALITQSDKILLGQQSPDREFYPGVWDVPGGLMLSERFLASDFKPNRWVQLVKKPSISQAA